MARHGDGQTGSLVFVTTYNFISRRISITENVQTLKQTAECGSEICDAIRQVIFESKLLQEESRLLISELNTLVKSLGLESLPHNSTVPMRSK